MAKNKVAVVYNTCGIKHDNIDYYIKCIDSLLEQNLDNYKIILSSCRNSYENITKIYKRYNKKISYVYYKDVYTVNVTFNRTVQLFHKKYPDTESYLYVDSGCCFKNSTTKQDETSFLKNIYNTHKRYNNSLVYGQVNSDEALNYIDPTKYTAVSSGPQVIGEDLEVPLGVGCNLHICLFNKVFFETYNNKIIPDVFKAYCTESVFRYLAAGCNTKWYYMKDQQVIHEHSMDGPSAGFANGPDHSGWKHLLYDRDIFDIINDPEVSKAGIGYEEGRGIIRHNPKAYDSNGYAKDPKKIVTLMNKYFFLNDDELNYNNIHSQHIIN